MTTLCLLDEDYILDEVLTFELEKMGVGKAAVIFVAEVGFEHSRFELFIKQPKMFISQQVVFLWPK